MHASCTPIVMRMRLIHGPNFAARLLESTSILRCSSLKDDHQMINCLALSNGDVATIDILSMYAICGAQYVHRKLGDYEGAAKDYNEALQRGECNVRTYTNFAFCLAKLGYYAEAVRAYDSVLELDSANENALHNR